MPRLSHADLQKITDRVIEEAKSPTGTWSLATCNEIRQNIQYFNDEDISYFLGTIIGLISDDSVSSGCRYKVAQLCSLLKNYNIPKVDNFLTKQNDNFVTIAERAKNKDKQLGEATAKLLYSLSNITSNINNNHNNNNINNNNNNNNYKLTTNLNTKSGSITTSSYGKNGEMVGPFGGFKTFNISNDSELMNSLNSKRRSSMSNMAAIKSTIQMAMPHNQQSSLLEIAGNNSNTSNNTERLIIAGDVKAKVTTTVME